MTKDAIIQLIQDDAYMMRVLQHVQSLHLPDWWIGAGFVRNKVWNHLTGIQTDHDSDIDVAYYNSNNASEEQEHIYENQLRDLLPNAEWSVTNQARMHVENGTHPYTSTLDAIAHWPETATAIAIKLSEAGNVQLECLYGLDDLAQMIIRPTPVFKGKMHIFQERMKKKQWEKRWPGIQFKDCT